MNVNVIDIDDIFQSHTFIISPKRPANKFVILKNSDLLIFITGKIDKFPYHAQLIEWFCNKNNLAFSWSHKPDFLEIYEYDYSIWGGGYVNFNQDKQKYEFYGFYHRIREKLEQFWGRNIQDQADKMMKSGRSIASDTNHITSLTIELNKRGEIVNVNINSASGVRELDSAAIDTFNQAGPFPNPPTKMLKQGKATIKWSFVVNT